MTSDDDSSSLIFVLIGAAAVLWLVIRSERLEPNLKHIPTFGHNGYLLSYIDALKFACNGDNIVQKKYEKYRSSIFKVATLNRWIVVVDATKLMEELRRLPEHDVSVVVPLSELSLRSHRSANYHVPNAAKEACDIARQISQRLSLLIPDIADEIQVLAPVVSVSAPGWIEVDIKDLTPRLTTRAINRALVGLLTRNEEYDQLTASSRPEQLGIKLRLFFNVLPACIFDITIFDSTARIRRYMQNIVRNFVDVQRKAAASQRPAGDSSRFDDMLSQLLSHSENAADCEKVTQNIVNISLTAYESVSSTMEHLLHDLSSYPKYVNPIREEIRCIVRREGWSKQSLDKMHKLDSFIKESIRLHQTSSLVTLRKTLKAFTFSDGTYIPANTFLATTASPRHRDDHLYPAANKFDGFRFSNMHENVSDGKGAGVRFQLTTAAPEYLAWGYGRHACPGRFFAAVVLKMILGHLLLHYDVRLQDGAIPQQDFAACSETKISIKRL